MKPDRPKSDTLDRVNRQQAQLEEAKAKAQKEGGDGGMLSTTIASTNPPSNETPMVLIQAPHKWSMYEEMSTELHNAIHANNPELLEKLLEKSVEDIDKRDYYGFTPLHLSVYPSKKGAEFGVREPKRIECCSLLIAYGANLELKEQFGATPLILACLSHYPAREACEMLLGAKASVLSTDMYGQTAVHAAAAQNRFGQLQVLMTHANSKEDAIVAKTIKDNEGMTPLDRAHAEMELDSEGVMKLNPYMMQVAALLSPDTGNKAPNGKAVKK